MEAVPHRTGRELGKEFDDSSGAQSAKQRVHDAVDVVQREAVQDAVIRGPLPGLPQAADLRGQAEVRVQSPCPLPSPLPQTPLPAYRPAYQSQRTGGRTPGSANKQLRRADTETSGQAGQAGGESDRETRSRAYGHRDRQTGIRTGQTGGHTDTQQGLRTQTGRQAGMRTRQGRGHTDRRTRGRANEHRDRQIERHIDIATGYCHTGRVGGACTCTPRAGCPERSSPLGLPVVPEV